MNVKQIIITAFKTPGLALLQLRTYIRMSHSPRNGDISLSHRGVRFTIDLSIDPAMKAMYYRCYELDTEYIMRRYLKKGGTFVDIGANIGYFSALGMSIVGKGGRVIGFEPAPKYYRSLCELANKNNGYRLEAHCFALGDKEGSEILAITNLPNIGWNTLVPNFMSKETVKETIQVPVRRFDNFARGANISRIDLIKIDTEGYELPILKGFGQTLYEWYPKPAIICEIAPTAYSNLGETLFTLKKYMFSAGYQSFDIPYLREIDICQLNRTTNVVFLADNHRRF